MENNKIAQDMSQVLIEGEQLIWSGKPHRKAYIYHRFLTMLPFALLWGMIDFGFIVLLFKSGQIQSMLWFILPFFAIHLLPVWSWLGSVLTARKRWENASYTVTDKRIIIKNGFIGMDYKTIYYKDIKNVYLKVGFVDKIFKVGNIYFDTLKTDSFSVQAKNSLVGQNIFECVENSYELYTKFQKIVMDIQTDIEYPNKLRPDTNPGYNTKYKPKE